VSCDFSEGAAASLKDNDWLTAIAWKRNCFSFLL